MVENRLHSGSGVGGSRFGRDGDHAVILEHRIGLSAVAVEREMIPSGAFSDDQHEDGLVIIPESGVRQQNLFPVAFAYLAIVAEGVDRVGPWHQKAAQNGCIAVYPWPVGHVGEDQDNDCQERHTGVAPEPLRLTEIYLLHTDIDRRKHSQQEDIGYSRSAEEAGSFGKTCIEDIAHHRGIDHHVVGVDEIKADGICYQAGCNYATADAPSCPEQEVAEEIVQGEHHKDKRGCDEHSVEAVFHFLQHDTEEWLVVSQEGEKAYDQADCAEFNLFFHVV